MNKTFTVVIVLITLALIGGAVWLFTRSAEKEKQTQTTQTTSSNTGLSGLLGGLNLEGLTIFGAG